MLVYKYRDCAQRTWELLLNRKLFFATPGQLNDPLDSSIDIQAEYERAKALVKQSDVSPDARRSFLIYMLGDHHRFTDPVSGNDMGLNHALQHFLRSLGILSLSRTPTDALLWSHYAGGHCGVCLGFDTEKLLMDHVFISGDMEYAQTPPYVDLFLKMTDELGEFVKPWDKSHRHSDEKGEKFYTSQLSRLMRANLLVKSRKWSYEEEYRIISTVPGNHGFTPEALREVVLGMKIRSSDRETLDSILRHPEYSHVKVRTVKNVAGTFEFGITD